MDLFHDPERIDSYMVEHSSEEDPVLKELSRHTYLNEVHPRMLSGHILGSFLRMFSQLTAPGQILEIGTYTGYSAICLASGLKPGGELTTIEVNEELCETALRFFKKAGISDKVTLLNGDALEIIPTFNETFDLVFIDANKEEYPDYYLQVFDKVRAGGYILADNVLWGGKVLDDQKEDTTTASIRHFNRMITEDQRVDNYVLPIRDGVMVIKKL